MAVRMDMTPDRRRYLLDQGEGFRIAARLIFCDQAGQYGGIRNELPQAQAQLEKAVSLSPSDARLHFLLGHVYKREGVDGKAKIEFEGAASLNGNRSTPNYRK